MLKRAIRAHAAIVVVVSTSACGIADDCDFALTCPSYANAGATTEEDAGSKPDAPPPECAQKPSEPGFTPRDKCGVFAAPSATSGGDGSMARPFSSLGAAVSAAASTGKVVYACLGVFAESLHVPSGVTVLGGLDCQSAWSFKEGARTTLAPASGGEIGVRLLAGEGVTTLEDIDVVAPDAVAPGASSIAVLVEDTQARLTRCTLAAGDGKPGSPGAHADDDGALDGFEGSVGYDICGATTQNPGPKGTMKVCGPLASHGGDGGDGGRPPGDPGGDGKPGLPLDASWPGAGLGGAGQSVAACTPGLQGADGARGAAGEGASGQGAISLQGYLGSPGSAGKRGLPGQGGGGGGGSKGKAQVACLGAASLARAGATGGSGGTGGCGGQGGEGGQPGGSSIGIISLSKLPFVLTDVALKIGRGGDGGNGGAGQNGGNGGFGKSGGQGANGTANGCHGGDGGHGGQGGAGGGGLGGHAIGVAHVGQAPKGNMVITFAGGVPAPGKGGAPGAASAPPSGAGMSGVWGDVVSFEGM